LNALCNDRSRYLVLVFPENKPKNVRLICYTRALHYPLSDDLKEKIKRAKDLAAMFNETDR